MAEENDVIVEVAKTELRQKLEAFQLLASGGHYMTINLSKNKMHLSLDNQDAGFVSRVVDCEYSGKEFSIHLNPKMTYEFCRTFTGGNWVIKMKNAIAPILIKSIEDENCIFLQSPIGPQV